MYEVKLKSLLGLLMLVTLTTAKAGEANHLFDSARSGYTKQTLKSPFKLAWTHRFTHKPRQAWKEPVWEPQRIDFDYAYAVSAGNGLVFVASSSDHAVHAIDLKTGEERWRFFTGGPVRLSPHVQGENVWFSSDDGWVYCLMAKTGRIVWKYRPKIPDERLIGNEQMISRWPARSGVLVVGDRAYTTFGMWSPEGIVVTCLNAKTGKLIWQNDNSDTYYMTQPHFEAMGGVSPQGYLALRGDTLVVPCGRAAPAFFDAKTGEFLYHESEGLFPGGAWTMLHGDLTFMACPFLHKPNPVAPEGSEADIHPEASLVAINSHTHKEVFHLHGALQGVVTPDGILNLIGRKKLLSVELKKVLDKAPSGYRKKRGSSQGHFVEVEPLQRWSTQIDRVYKLVQAGDILIAGGRGTLAAYKAKDGSRVWAAEIKGSVRDLLVVDGAILASTTEGEVHCFVTGDTKAAKLVTTKTAKSAEDKTAARLLSAVENLGGGYALLLGAADTPFISSLVSETKYLWHWATTDTELNSIRRELADIGVYGDRVAVHKHRPGKLPYTDYLINLILLRFDKASELAKLPAGEMYRVLRPCGGVAVITCPSETRAAVKAWLLDAKIPDSEIKEIALGYRIVRGPLADVGEWTHPLANAGKTGASTERRVRLPLKVLWFGSIGPADMISRHYRAPAPLVINGRMFVMGLQYLHAVDAYNGHLLWKRALPDVGRWPAKSRGGSSAVDTDYVYVLQGTTCLQIDQSTGKTRQILKTPKDAKPPRAVVNDLENKPTWEYLAVTDKLVIGTYGRANVRKIWWSNAEPENTLLFAMDKKTGKEKWRYVPKTAIDTSAIAIDDGKLFLIDGIADFRVVHGRTRKLIYKATPTEGTRELKAIDLATGRELWKTDKLGSGQRALWAANGVVLATHIGIHGRRMITKGPGLSAFSSKDGKPLWSDRRRVLEPVIIGNTVYSPVARELLTGKMISDIDPLTGKSYISRHGLLVGCSRPAACPNLVMQRSGSLGFVDLRQKSGAYTYPNMRASCWLNMVPASGLVLIPEGSSSCPCAYNYKTSIAFMSANRHNNWGLFTQVRRSKGARVREMRLNLGAPGDKPSKGGKIWHTFPRPSTTGPRGGGGMDYIRRDTVPVEMVSAKDTVKRISCNPDWTTIAGTKQPWIYTCGLIGPVKLKITMGKTEAATEYRVVLHFCDLEGRHERGGDFSVKMQGRVVFSGLNVMRDAGMANRALIKQTTLKIGETLTLEIVPTGKQPPLFTGLEVIAK